MESNSNLITLSNPRSPVSEAYRSLRTNLDFYSFDRPLRTLIVTSAGPDEGKSTTLANLGIIMAQSGKRVVLADCDLRRPSLHKLFEIRNTAGITDMLRDEQALAQPPFQEGPVPNLRLLPSGHLPPNPADLLGSRRMGQVIDALLKQSDLILFDAPPVIAVTDAAVLASKVDGVLLVVNEGKTKREHAKKAKTLLEKVNARLIGVVLNNAQLDTSLQPYYASEEGPTA